MLFKVGQVNAVPPPDHVELAVDPSGVPVIIDEDGAAAELATSGGPVDGADIIAASIPNSAMADIGGLTPDLDAATNTAQGALSADLAAGMPRVATARLTDADATISPGTDKCSRYILPAGTLTTNRILSIDTTGSSNTDSVEIVCLDTSVNTYQIKTAGGATCFTKGASDPARIYRCYMTGGVWVGNEKMWCGS